MKNCTIAISLYDEIFVSNFSIAGTTPEYVIADEAFRLALMFAKTQIIAKYGYFDYNTFSKFMRDLEYSYTIE